MNKTECIQKFKSSHPDGTSLIDVISFIDFAKNEGLSDKEIIEAMSEL